MGRVRISTTVDGQRLERLRALSGLRDSELVDLALETLVDRLEREQEIAAHNRAPYEDDPDLAWRTPAAPALPYDGDIPADVLQLAECRRRQRSG